MAVLTKDNHINNELNDCNHASSTVKNENEKSDQTNNSDENLKKKKFYKTCSIHFKTIPSNIKIADLENVFFYCYDLINF